MDPVISHVLAAVGGAVLMLVGLAIYGLILADGVPLGCAETDLPGDADAPEATTPTDDTP